MGDKTVPNLPSRFVVCQHGHDWRDYGDMWSMARASDDNLACYPVAAFTSQAQADALRDTLLFMAADGCEASRAHGEHPPVYDRCLDYEYRDDKPTGDPDVDRCYPCIARAALPSDAMSVVRDLKFQTDLAYARGFKAGHEAAAQPAPDLLAAARAYWAEHPHWLDPDEDGCGTGAALRAAIEEAER